MAQRELECPFCSGQVLVKKGGKTLSTISTFLQRSFSLKIPTGLLSFIQDNAPTSKKSIIKGQCEVCKGKGTIKDPSDITSKIEKVKSNFKNAADQIAEWESHLAPACGNRYTIIQGSDLLEVGIGLNDAPSYNVEKEKSVRSKGLIGMPKIDTKKGAPMFPVGAPANHVQGINSAASPGGHYVIKCSNKFSLITGAQGVEITSGGPITISGGITRITGPEISIGTQTGRLHLEGEVVNINGKSIEAAPSDGHFFVKGTISNTGNLMVAGHTHTESASFIHAECMGRNETTHEAGSPDRNSGPAFWGSIAVEGIEAAAADMVGFTQNNTLNVRSLQNIAGARFFAGLKDRTQNLAYHAIPYEQVVTGWIIPTTTMITKAQGTGITLKGVCTCPCNYGGPAGGTINIQLGQMEIKLLTQTVLENIDLHNFPHNHALPDGKHSHTVRMPDIDFSADTPDAVRSKQAAVHEAAPADKTMGLKKAIEVGVHTVESFGALSMKGTLENNYAKV